jgi:hypothetical protein
LADANRADTVEPDPRRRREQFVIGQRRRREREAEQDGLQLSGGGQDERFPNHCPWMRRFPTDRGQCPVERSRPASTAASYLTALEEAFPRHLGSELAKPMIHCRQSEDSKNAVFETMKSMWSVDGNACLMLSRKK